MADCAANAVRTEYRGWQSGNACAVSGTDQQCYRRPAYTPNGRQKTLKDANGNTTSYTYDGFDRLTRTTFPDATYEQLTLDENGNVTARRNRAGQTLTYAYNDLDWLAEKVSPSPAVTTDWTYLLDGRVDLLSDTAANAIDYGYDTAGRLIQVVTTMPGLAAKTVGYELDENGNRTKLTWPDGYYVGYCYDSLNRMTDAGENATDCTSNPLAHYSYDPQSRRSALAYAGSSGASVAYGYSDAGDLLTLNHAMVGTGDPQYTFAYTDAHQLKTETQASSVYVWQPTATATTSYGTANNLNQYPTVAGLTQSHDANGNLTGDGTFAFTYDAENRLLTASRTGLAASYQYDPLGRRTRKSGTGTVPAVFLTDGADEIAEYDGSGTLTNRYIPGPGIDQTIAMIQVPASGPVTKWFFHTNKQGSLIAATDETGVRTAGPYIYDPHGNCFKGSLPCTTSTLTTIPFKYTGRRLDPETGLYYYRARYYDPITGRFLQVDPVGYDADLNLYTYVGNDPTDKTDPTGLWYCGKSKNSCATTKESLKLLKGLKQAHKLTQAQQQKLDKVLGFLGDFSNQADNVRVDEHGGSRSLTTPLGQGRFAISLGTTGGATGTAGRVAHEGWHGVEIMRHGGYRTSGNARESWDMEMRAYTLESWVDKGLGYAGPGSMWSPSWTNDESEDKIRKGALDSTSDAYPSWSMNPDDYDYAARHYEADWTGW